MHDLELCARVRRISLSAEEQGAFLQRALRLATQSAMVGAEVRVEALGLSDHTQTYRATGAGDSAILKILPPEIAGLTTRVHNFLRQRGIALPRILWADPQNGAILYEDLGTERVPASRDAAELARIMRYLAKLHDVAIMNQQTASVEFPELSAQGFPKQTDLAANILRRYGALTPGRTNDILEAAVAAVEGMPSLPFLAISDIKREHFLMSRGEPVLVDLEMASFWELPAANLATLLSFPGQFTLPLDAGMKIQLVQEYVSARRKQSIEPESIWRAVKACEFLMSLTLSRAAEHCRSQPGYMVRDRRFETGSREGNSVEAEIGSANFKTLYELLNNDRALHVLDLASGIGEALRDIAKRWPQHRLISLDLYPSPGAPVAVCGDAQSLPFASNSFDVVLCTQLLQYIPDKLALISDVYRVLKTGGLAIFAMTEHFGSESGFSPRISEIALTTRPAGVLRNVELHEVGQHRVSTFSMVRQDSKLIFPCKFQTAVPLRNAGSIDCYYQTRYTWRAS